MTTEQVAKLMFNSLEELKADEAPLSMAGLELSGFTVHESAQIYYRLGAGFTMKRGRELGQSILDGTYRPNCRNPSIEYGKTA